MGGNKQISCKVCSKVMKSDNVKRHKQICQDIDKEAASKNTDVNELHKSLTEGVDTMKLENIILYDNINRNVTKTC